MSVSLAELCAAAAARQAPLAAESAGYLVLAVADQVGAAPRTVSVESVQLNEDGAVRLSSALPCSEPEAERQLRGLLDELLLVASSLTPSLVRVSRRAAGTGLALFVSELESALIPVNRAAARRALARLARETARAVDQGLAIASPAPSIEPVAPVQNTLPPVVIASVVPPLVLELSPSPPPAHAPARRYEVETRMPSEQETRPEPLVRKAAAPLSAQTPRLGTMMAEVTGPRAELEVELERSELTDPMPPLASESLHPQAVAEASTVMSEPSQPQAAELEVQPPAAELEAEAPLELEVDVEFDFGSIKLDAAPQGEPEPEPEPEPRARLRREPMRSELSTLLQTFGSGSGPSEPELRYELKLLAGVEQTPAPVSTANPESRRGHAAASSLLTPPRGAAKF